MIESKPKESKSPDRLPLWTMIPAGGLAWGVFWESFEKAVHHGLFPDTQEFNPASILHAVATFLIAWPVFNIIVLIHRRLKVARAEKI